MAGNLNINSVIKLFIIILLFTSCEKDYNLQQKFIENNFLTIIDTIAYQQGSFRPLPPLPNKTVEDVVLYSNLSVKLFDSIVYNERIQKEIDYFFNQNRDLKIAFQDVLNNINYLEFSINTDFSKKIGKYHIFLNEEYENKSYKYVGEIKIQNFKINKDKAFLIVSKSVGHSRIVFIKLFIKEKGYWKLVKKEALFES